jgi:hypothetical protein
MKNYWLDMKKKKQAAPMGIGALGQQNVVFKRKFRWTVEWKDRNQAGLLVPATFVKVAARPELTIEEVPLNAKSWIPGKAEWQSCSFTYYDTDEITLKPLYELLAEQYEMAELKEKIEPKYRSIDEEWQKLDPPKVARDLKVIMRLYDGVGYELENWELNQVQFEKIDFGELDYSSSSQVDVTVTVKYKEVKYHSNMPIVLNTACTPQMTDTAICHSTAITPTMGIGPIRSPNVII